MVSEALQMNHLTNGEADDNLYRESEKTRCRHLNGSNGDVRSMEFSSNCAHADEDSLEISGIATRDSAGTSNCDMHPDVIPVCETMGLNFHSSSFQPFCSIMVSACLMVLITFFGM